MISNLNYQNMIQIIYAIIKNLADVFKATNDRNYQDEIRDCIQAGVNIFNEFITVSESKFRDIKEYTVSLY